MSFSSRKETLAIRMIPRGQLRKEELLTFQFLCDPFFFFFFFFLQQKVSNMNPIIPQQIIHLNDVDMCASIPVALHICSDTILSEKLQLLWLLPALTVRVCRKKRIKKIMFICNMQNMKMEMQLRNPFSSVSISVCEPWSKIACDAFTFYFFFIFQRKV